MIVESVAYALLGLAALLVVGLGAERAIAPPRSRVLGRQRPVARRIDPLTPTAWACLLGAAAVLGYALL